MKKTYTLLIGALLLFTAAAFGQQSTLSSFRLKVNKGIQKSTVIAHKIKRVPVNIKAKNTQHQKQSQQQMPVIAEKISTQTKTGAKQTNTGSE